MRPIVALILAAGLLLVFDLVIGSIASLYPTTAHEIALAMFLTAVVVTIGFGPAWLLFALHNLALIGLYLRGAEAGYGYHVDPGLVMLVVLANLLVWLTARARRASRQPSTSP